MSANDPKRTFSKFCCLSVSKIETFRRLVRRYLPGCSRSPEGVTFAACSPRGGAMTDPCSRRKLTAEADGTIYGDGVNIAARLEALAEGGRVCISSTVYDAVEGKLACGFDFLGEQQVKNIAKPVRVYC